MGGQETLLLVARYPRLLAGAIAFDAVTNLARQYADLPELRCDTSCRREWAGPIGPALQTSCGASSGGTPAADPRGYALRSPSTYAARIAFSGVPLELWWSVSDLVVPDQATAQSGALFDRLRRLDPAAPVEGFVGAWIHSHEQRATTRLPYALAQLGLLPHAGLWRARRPARPSLPPGAGVRRRTPRARRTRSQRVAVV